MSKPIQDRIFRSRLTIKYRTNIDGVPVPQTLPLRLLVLGDFTGRKRTGENEPKGLHVLETRPLSERRVYSIKRGFRVDDLMKELDISFPIPTPDEELKRQNPALAKRYELLSDSAVVAGGIKAEAPDRRFSVKLDELDDSGGGAIEGKVDFEAVLYDNVDMELVGTLDAVVKVSLAVSNPEALVSLPGELAIPAKWVKGKEGGALDLKPGDLVPVQGKTDEYKVPVSGAVQLHGDDSGPPWIMDENATGELTGKKTDKKLVASGTIKLAVTNGKELQLSVKDVEISLGADDKPETVTITATSKIGVVIEGSVKLGDLLPGAGATRLPIGRGGKIHVPINNQEINLGKSGSSPVTATVSGEISSDLNGLIETNVPWPFSRKGGSASPAAGPARALDLRLNIALADAPAVTCEVKGEVQVALDVSVDRILGRARGKTKTADLPGSGALDVNDIVADVACAGVRNLGGTISLEQDKNGTNSRLVVKIEKGECDARRTIRIRSLDSFTPDAVARMIPEIRRLRILQNLLQELKSDINLIPGVRKAVADLLTKAIEVKDPEAKSEDPQGKLTELKQVLSARYPALVIERTAAEATSDASPDVAWFEGFYEPRARALIKAAEIQDDPKDRPKIPPREDARPALVMLQGKSLSGYEFHDYDTSDQRVLDSDRLLNGLAALIINHPHLKDVKPGQLGDKIDELIERETPECSLGDGRHATIKQLMHDHVASVLDNPDFRYLERNWRDLFRLCDEVETDEVLIDVLDVGPYELATDMEDHRNDIFTSALFKKIYVEEYDRYGGRPFAAMIGLYHLNNNDEDISFLETVAQIANAAHCPFITGVGPEFFGSDIKSWSDLEAIGDIEAHLNLPKFGKWNRLREAAEAAYVGLTLPGYLARQPWGAEEKQLGNGEVKYNETTNGFRDHYLWGNSAALFAGNLVRSFEGSGWCQYIRGVKGGGLVQGLTVHTLKRHGKEEAQPPVEFEIADYREFQFSKAGLIPLIHCKGSSDATFFSAQSIKRPRDFRSEIDTQNAYLVTNLAYTLSITRIAHYVKRMMRDYIGSTADAGYIQNVLQLWLDDYVTTTVNPDDLTLRYYPFKAVSVAVEPKPGPLGWYKAVISILPHVQFEGMDVELRLEAALGGK